MRTTIIMAMFLVSGIWCQAQFTTSQKTWLNSYITSPLTAKVSAVDIKVNGVEAKRKLDSSRFSNTIVTLNAQISNMAISISTLTKQIVAAEKRIDSLQTRALKIGYDSTGATKFPIKFYVSKGINGAIDTIGIKSY